jgi:hypothetical protein
MENENKFTPGPWRAGKYSVNNYQISVYGADQTKICMLEGWNEECLTEAEANASLIASAPDLLAACEAALVYLIRECPSEEINTSAFFVRKQLREAISRAKGE